MPPPMVLLAILGILALILGVWAATSAYEGKRRRAIADKAIEMGMQVAEEVPDLTETLPPFKVFRRGRGRRAQNVLTGSRSGMSVILADYQYTTGSGKNSSTHRQTVCVLQANDARLPHCFLRHEVPILDAIGEKLGGQDIDFPEDPGFSKAFVLQGEDPAATRRLFEAGVRTHFTRFAKTRLELETRGSTLVLHRGVRVKPEELRDLLQQAMETLDILRRAV